jgi:hypothetical protein
MEGKAFFLQEDDIKGGGLLVNKILVLPQELCFSLLDQTNSLEMERQSLKFISDVFPNPKDVS